MAKEKTGRNFHLYENELNSLKKRHRNVGDNKIIVTFAFKM